mmetsp:Transcript_42726/g.54913  ORF Transcript_42726/g.54913 Transcript_42726/m.54913 type:complete len:897 (+) Transcript_42726:25-2715(+)
MQRPSWPRRRTDGDDVIENLETVTTNVEDENITQNTEKKKTLRLGLLESSNSTSKSKSNSTKPMVGGGPSKITSALIRARENANNVGAKASTMVEGAKLHAKLQIVAAAEAASISASQMAASARESADNVASVAAASAAAVSQSSTSDKRYGGNGFPRSAMKGSRLRELNNNFCQHQQKFGIGTYPFIPPSSSTSTSPVHLSSSSSASSSTKEGLGTLNMNTPPNMNLNVGKVWFTEKVKVYCYDPYSAVQLPRRFGSNSSGGGSSGKGGVGLSLDAFLTRRPRPTYTALSREGKEGILKVPAPAIRHRRSKRKHHKRKSSLQNNQSQGDSDDQDNHHIKNGTDHSGTDHHSSPVHKDSKQPSTLINDDQSNQNAASGDVDDVGLWKGFVHQWLKPTPSSVRDKSTSCVQNNGDIDQSLRSSTDDHSSDHDDHSVGGGGGSSSVGYDSEGSFSSSWFSDDSARSRLSSEKYDSDENNDDENGGDDDGEGGGGESDNIEGKNDIKVISSNQSSSLKSFMSGPQEEWKKLRNSTRRNRHKKQDHNQSSSSGGGVGGGGDDDKWEKRRQARDRWWQKVATLSSGNSSQQHSHSSSGGGAGAGGESNEISFERGKEMIIKKSRRSRQDKRQSQRYGNGQWSDIEGGSSTDTETSDWAGFWGSDSENDGDINIDQDTTNRNTQDMLDSGRGKLDSGRGKLDSGRGKLDHIEDVKRLSPRSDTRGESQAGLSSSPPAPLSSTSPPPPPTLPSSSTSSSSSSSSKVSAVARAMAEVVSEARLRSKEIKKLGKPKLQQRRPSWRGGRFRSKSPTRSSQQQLYKQHQTKEGQEEEKNHVDVSQGHVPSIAKPQPPPIRQHSRLGFLSRNILACTISIGVLVILLTSLVTYTTSPVETLRSRGVLP